MDNTLTREEAFTLLKKYNKEPFHIQHALTVEGTMRWFAQEMGYGQEVDYWGNTGLLILNFTPISTARKRRSF